ncbi:MAG: hypothetical protein M0C28_40190 [Candidatus Moduliflexus flocculans]|nr:hypothetical protein [Candidatus Moduliflexus flocculans]
MAWETPGIRADDLERSLFPIVEDKLEYRDWLWLLEPGKASPEQKAKWLGAERYSLEEMALRADLNAFFARRLDINGELARGSLAKSFGPRARYPPPSWRS